MFYALRLQLSRRLAKLYDWADDLIRWSRPGLYVKRWVLLLLFALTATALGIAFFLVEMYRSQPFPEFVYYLTLQFLGRPWRGALFLIIGGGISGFAVFQLNRSLVSAVQAPYSNERLVDLVYNYRLPQRLPTVVAFAGHRGFAALQARSFAFAHRLISVSSVTESSGLVAPGTVPVQTSDAVLLPVRGSVELCAELQHGTILENADAIRARRSGVPIKRVFLNPVRPDEGAAPATGDSMTGRLSMPVNPAVLAAIREADIVLLGPGSFYLTVVPNLLLEPIAKALQVSQAKKILIANLMTEPGQTDGFTVADYVRTIHLYGGFTLDYVLVNTGTADRNVQDRYAAVLAEPVLAETQVRKNGPVLSAGRQLRKLSMTEGAVVVGADLVMKTAEQVIIGSTSNELVRSAERVIVLRHDPDKLATALIRLLGVNVPARAAVL